MDVDDYDEGDYEDTTAAALHLTSLPANANAYLAAVTGEEQPVTGIDYAQSYTKDRATYYLGSVDDSEMFIAMVNQGNVLEIEAEFKKQLNQGYNRPAYTAWQTIASPLLDLQDDAGFGARRALILRPSDQMGIEDVQELIDDAKRDLLNKEGVPEGVELDEISWDALSFKIPPSCSEYFCQKYPQMVDQLSLPELSMLNEVEKMIYATVIEKCSEFRTRTNTTEDPFIPDVTLYLERQLAGDYDMNRTTKFDTLGELLLVKYVDMMSAVFATGNIPGGIPPAKIFAAHDVISAVELRSTINRLSEQQTKDFFQYTSTRTMNPNTFRRTQNISDGQSKLREEWSKAQNAQILLKQRVDQNLAVGQYALSKQEYNKPQKELTNQLAGGNLNLSKQLDLNATDSVFSPNEEELEVLRYQVSLLLACLRVRAEANQFTPWELIPSADLDHFEIVKKLSAISNLGLNGQIPELAQTLQVIYQDGHNAVKFGDRQLPNELIDLIKYTVEGRARQLLKAIPIFEQNMMEDDSMLTKLLECGHMSVALKQRLSIEVTERYNRRSATTLAVDQLVK